MKLTSAQRAKRHIAKLKKEGKYEEFKLKRKLIDKKSRENKKKIMISMPPKKFVQACDEIREKTNERVKKHRKNGKSLQNIKTPSKKESILQAVLKKAEKQRQQTGERVRKFREKQKTLKGSEESVYKTQSAKRKALSRAQQGPPNSMGKRKEIVKVMYEKYFDSPKPTTPVKRCSGLDINVKNRVIAFYERPDITQTAPGRKDHVNVKDATGKKVKVQKKYLLFPINEVYDKFCLEAGTVLLHRSKFIELRPKHIVSVTKTPHNVCLCIHHSNFNFAINALIKAVPEMPKHSDHANFYETYFCDPITEECYFGKCKACKDVFQDTILGVVESSKDVNVKWQAWKKEDNRFQNRQQTGTLGTLAEYIVGLASHFFRHHHINSVQLESYKRCVSGVTTDKSGAVIQIDFAENYKCVFQDEASNAHWNQSQVSLFTAAIWTSGSMKSYSVVTDDQDHSKRTIVPYIDRLLEELPDGIKTVHIWSDGPTFQFKNKFIALALPVLERKHKMKVCWSFFAASHGKGPTDGTGGALKNQVWTAVKSRKEIVCNAQDFAKAVNTKSKVKVMVMDKSDIDQRNVSMNLNFEYENAKDVRGIFDFHHLQVINGKVVGYTTTKDVFKA